MSNDNQDQDTNIDHDHDHEVPEPNHELPEGILDALEALRADIEENFGGEVTIEQVDPKDFAEMLKSVQEERPSPVERQELLVASYGARLVGMSESVRELAKSHQRAVNMYHCELKTRNALESDLREMKHTRDLEIAKARTEGTIEGKTKDDRDAYVLVNFPMDGILAKERELSEVKAEATASVEILSAIRNTQRLIHDEIEITFRMKTNAEEMLDFVHELGTDEEEEVDDLTSEV